ncbi:MAG: hypothetical protein INH34_19630 [Phycisphaerales bacterium]|nr:hypothetical protein [Phycisphaerales bacterium]
MALDIHGAVSSLGNPWLGSECSPILGLSGVLDMARLDALQPGQTESVVAVGAAGMATIRWGATPQAFVVTPISDPALAGAPIVRAIPVTTQHQIAVVTASRTSVRTYRSTGQLVGTGTNLTPTPIRDLEMFCNAAGAPRLLLRNDTGIRCHTTAGALSWQVSGSGGALVRLPRTSSARVAWLHQSAGAWRVAVLGDNGVLGNYPLGQVLAPTDALQAAFAADADRDGDTDLVVKTSAGVAVLRAQSEGNFTAATATWHASLQPSATSIPDVVATHAGRRLRLVDAFGNKTVSWERVDVQAAQQNFAADDLMTLEVTGDRGGFGGASGAITNLECTLRTTPEALAGVYSPATQVRMQVVTWVQEKLDGEGAKLQAAESNLLFNLTLPSGWQFSDSLWPVNVPLQLPYVQERGWEGDRYYWVTVRLVQTAIGSNTPLQASEPITLVTSMSERQRKQNWPYLNQYFPEPACLPYVLQLTSLGGGVVGVIERADSPPPPPPSGIPTPRQATNAGQITGDSVPN